MSARKRFTAGSLRNNDVPENVAKKILEITGDYQQKFPSYQFEKVPVNHQFTFLEGDKFHVIDLNGGVQNVELPVEHNTGASGMITPNAIGGRFELPANTWLLNIYYTTKYMAKVFAVSEDVQFNQVYSIDEHNVVTLNAKTSSIEAAIMAGHAGDVTSLVEIDKTVLVAAIMYFQHASHPIRVRPTATPEVKAGILVKEIQAVIPEDAIIKSQFKKIEKSAKVEVERKPTKVSDKTKAAVKTQKKSTTQKVGTIRKENIQDILVVGVGENDGKSFKCQMRPGGRAWITLFSLDSDAPGNMRDTAKKTNLQFVPATGVSADGAWKIPSDVLPTLFV